MAGGSREPTPELIKRWWSAKRGEVTVAGVDLRVGGEWRDVMVARPAHEQGSRRGDHPSGMEAGLQDALDLLEEVAISLR